MTELPEMYWPTKSQPVPMDEIGWSNLVYLADRRAYRDPTMVWGTSMEMDGMDEFLKISSRQSNRIISIVHVLITAVFRSLCECQKLNRRVLNRKVFPYDGVSLVVPIRRASDGVVDLIYIRHGESLALEDVATRIWEEVRSRSVDAAQTMRKKEQESPLTRRRARLWLNIRLRTLQSVVGFFFGLTNRIRLPSFSGCSDEINGANAVVNYLGFAGAPPMIAYKPSCLPSNSFGVQVTMGASEEKVVVRDNQIVRRTIAPVFVRVDHRLVNGFEAGQFIATLKRYLENPSSLSDVALAPDSDHISEADSAGI